MGMAVHQAGVDEALGAMDMRQVEDLDLRFYVVELHLAGEFVHERRLVLIDDGREVDRAGRQRRHVGAEFQARRIVAPGFGRVRRSKTARSCPGSASALPPAPGGTDRGRTRVIRRGRAHGYGPARRLPRRPRASTSICSAGVTGRAGLSRLRGTEPVMATEMMTGDDMAGLGSGRGERTGYRRGRARCAEPHRSPRRAGAGPAIRASRRSRSVRSRARRPPVSVPDRPAVNRARVTRSSADTGFDLWAIADDVPPPASLAVPTSFCTIRATSWPILPSEPATSASQAPNPRRVALRVPGRRVGEAEPVAPWRPRSRRPRSPSSARVPTGPPSCSFSSRGGARPGRARWRASGARQVSILSATVKGSARCMRVCAIRAVAPSRAEVRQGGDRARRAGDRGSASDRHEPQDEARVDDILAGGAAVQVPCDAARRPPCAELAHELGHHDAVARQTGLERVHGRA